MIKPELEFVYEASGELEPPREIGKVVDGTRRIIPITSGGYVKGPRISGKLMGNSADWQLTRPDGVTVADAIYAIETNKGWFAARKIKAGDQVAGLPGVRPRF